MCLNRPGMFAFLSSSGLTDTTFDPRSTCIKSEAYVGQVQAPQSNDLCTSIGGSISADTNSDALDFEDFFENGAVALHLVAGDGTILRANKAELELVGFSAAEYVGRNIVEFHADSPVIEDILTRLLSGETLRKYPARLNARDGSIKHVEITSSAQFRDGEFINTRCFTVDVTDLHRAREEIRRKDDQLRQLLDALPAAIYTTDQAGKITYYNRAAAELAGREPEIGKDEWCVTFKLFTPDGREMPYPECPMAIALKENRPVRGVEAVAQRPDGSFSHSYLSRHQSRTKTANWSAR